MSAQNLKALLPVTDLLLERALTVHRKNLSESQRVDAEIGEIDRLRKVAQEDMQQLGAHRMIGADTLWQGWLMQRRATLLRDAALCRAKELESFGRAREAFARSEAAQSLERAARREARTKQMLHEEERLQTLSILRGSFK